MGERDYKVMYKSRVLDEDEERPRVPRALDPYDGPYGSDSSRRRDRSARNSNTSLGESSTPTELARSTTRSSYPMREGGRSREVLADAQRSTRTGPPPSDNASVRRSIAVDQKRGDSPPRRSDPDLRSQASRDRAYVDTSANTYRGRGREYYIDDRPRPYGSPYVIEARQGDIIDISIPGRERERIYDSGTRSYGYEQDHGRRESNVIVRDRDRDYDRSQYNEYRSAPAPRRREYDREDDWKIVDSMRDTRIEPTRPRDEPLQSRSRAPTNASEDSYVMVSPSLASRPRERSRARSAIARSDYSGVERERRRSRSISFKGSQADYHDASERRHERPGAEADICGPYLKRRVPASDYDDQSDVQIGVRASDYRSRDGDADAFAATYRGRDTATYRERDGPYEPQMSYSPQKRDRSRRRRRDDEADDGSYYSENVTKKVVKETRYR